MRRVVIWLAVGLCTFVLGFAAASMWFTATRDVRERPCPPPTQVQDTLALAPGDALRDSANLPILAYCELVNNPERHSGKVVRVRATLRGFIHGILFSENTCPDRIAVSIPRGNEDVTRALTEAAGSEWFGHVPLDLIVVGKFEKVTPSNESDLLWDTASLHFEMMHVEKASKTR